MRNFLLKFKNSRKLSKPLKSTDIMRYGIVAVNRAQATNALTAHHYVLRVLWRSSGGFGKTHCRIKELSKA